jgi:ABC-type nitrate/sulfonate/bicarbonate transport system substrate-binding protein
MKHRKGRRNHWLPVAIVALVIAAGVAFQLVIRGGPPAPPTPSVPPASALVSIRLMGAFGPTFAGEMMALRQKLFEREGVRVELRPADRANDPIVSVANGLDTIGISRADKFLVARAQRVPIVAFAAAFVESPGRFYVLQKSGIRAPKDFVGRRVGRRAGDDTAIIYDALIARLGLPRSMIHEVPVEADLSKLLDGDIDVWPGHVGQEDYALARQGVDYAAITPGSYGIHVPGTVYFATERTIREQPQLVQRFLKAVIAGWELTYADLTTSVPIIAAFDEQALAADDVRFTLEHQREYVRPPAARFAEFDDSKWRSLHEILLKQRLLERSVDLSTAVAYEFLNEAYRKAFTFGK